MTLPLVHVGAPTQGFCSFAPPRSKSSLRMLLLHLWNGELHTVYNLLFLGLPQTPRAHQEPSDHQNHLGAVKHQENKLLSLHLTYTQLTLSSRIVATLERLISSSWDQIQVLDLSSHGSKHSLLFSWVVAGIQCVKGIINESGVDLYRVEKHP